MRELHRSTGGHGGTVWTGNWGRVSVAMPSLPAQGSGCLPSLTPGSYSLVPFPCVSSPFPHLYLFLPVILFSSSSHCSTPQSLSTSQVNLLKSGIHLPFVLSPPGPHLKLAGLSGLPVGQLGPGTIPRTPALSRGPDSCLLKEPGAQ